ncbi:hypothetical protein RJ640_016669 [Escallonia rubra]|uniref:Molybdopterin biosynthesis protein CNX1 n=1 Tax=Escallonia rubra TaxID=112253 RepID=A0AA88SG11_9ASTE|nr:hypothetical protein RJ640_016669 [Escallonia rubra]
MISADEALEIVLSVGQRLPPVTVALHDALDKILAEDIRAPDPLPPYPASVKDGYAVVASDGPGEYPIITESRAGNDGIGVTVTPGTVAYVTTGGSSVSELKFTFSPGPIPDGADAVVQVEDTELIQSDSVDLKRYVWEQAECSYESILPFQRPSGVTQASPPVSKNGCDLKRDAVILNSGERLDAAEIGLLATAGVMAVKVYPTPKIAVLSTGDELVEPITKCLGRGQGQYQWNEEAAAAFGNLRLQL